MSMPLEEQGPLMEKSDDGRNSKGLNLKATELRLGLPGSESPERENGNSVEDKNLYPLKCLVSARAKRDFSDTIGTGSGKWVFSGNGGSEVDLVKNSALFSPRGINGGGKIIGVGGSESKSQPTVMSSNAVKEAVPPVQKSVPVKKPQITAANGHGVPPASKARVVGWPPIRSFRKNSMATNPPKNDDDADAKLGSGCLYVKVSMDGAPYLRKVDLKTYSSYLELSLGLEKMFSCFTIGQCGSHEVSARDGLSESRLMDLLRGSEYVLTYEDKDGDWMLVGDVPWDMFTESCKRMRIMKSSDATGLAPRAMEKCRNRN